MTRPAHVLPLSPIPGLPPALHRAALNTLHNPRASSDGLLILADFLDELRAAFDMPPTDRVAIAMLADDLRQRAPDYAAEPAGGADHE